MTVQLALANSYGIAMASDRHIFRDGTARSTGQEVKLVPLHSPVPAAFMAAGPLAVLGLPVSRLALQIERALCAAAAAGRPEALGEAVLDALGQPLPQNPRSGATAHDPDVAILAETAEDLVQRALAEGRDPRAALEEMLLAIDQAPGCRDEQEFRAHGAATWEARAAELPRLVTKPGVAAAIREAPDLVGQVVVAALTRDWLGESNLYFTIGACCPVTGVPVLASLRLWRGMGERLMSVSRLASEYEAVWKANRTVVVAQGSGRAIIEAMIDGIADEHWNGLSAPGRRKAGPAMGARWDRAHDRIAVSSVREMAAMATGLVRGAEAVGYLTREGEGTIAPVDCLVMTPKGVSASVLPAGEEPDLREMVPNPPARAARSGLSLGAAG